MRCQHADSNPPLNAEYCTLSSSIPVVEMFNFCTIISLNPISRGIKLWFFFLVWIMHVNPPSVFPSFSLPSIHSFFLCITSAVLHSHLIHRGPGGELKQVFRHNCQSTYPPTYCWLQSLTVPWKHPFCLHLCFVFLWMYVVCQCEC